MFSEEYLPFVESKERTEANLTYVKKVEELPRRDNRIYIEESEKGTKVDGDSTIISAKVVDWNFPRRCKKCAEIFPKEGTSCRGCEIVKFKILGYKLRMCGASFGRISHLLSSKKNKKDRGYALKNLYNKLDGWDGASQKCKISEAKKIVEAARNYHFEPPNKPRAVGR